MAVGGPETDFARSRARLPLPEVISDAPADPTEGLGPDMGVPRLMQDDTAGYDATRPGLTQEADMGAMEDPGVTAEADALPAPQPGFDKGMDESGLINDPNAPAEQRGRVRRPLQRAPWNQNYRYTQGDFYGEGNPNITWTDARGVQMYVPQAGRLPMSIWVSEAQGVQQELARTRQAMSDLLAKTKVPETAPAYQPDFTRLHMGGLQNFLRGATAQYGGDEDLALQEIATEGSELNIAFRRQMADQEALAQHLKNGVAEATDWATGVLDGKIQATPQMRQAAYDYIHGVGSLKAKDVTGGDFSKAVRTIPNLQRYMNVDRFIKEFAVPNMQKAYMDIIKEVEREKTNRGQRVIDRREIKRIADKRLYDAMAERGEQMTSVPKEYFMDVLGLYVPEVIKQVDEIEFANLPTSGGSSGGGKSGGGIGMAAMYVKPTAAFTGRSGTEYKQDVIALAPRERVGDRNVPVKMATVYSDADGTQVDLITPELEHVRGKGYEIRGRRMDIKILNQLSDAERTTWEKYAVEPPRPTDADYGEWQRVQGKVEDIAKKTSPEISVPFKYNQKFGQDYYDGMTDGDAIYAKKFGISPEEVSTMLSTKEGTERLMRMVGLRGDEPKKEASKQSAQSDPLGIR